ncbi:phage baseplate assembly protein V [Streptomyces yerevanensis]|uniref:phage baseplate assembly protein V n=1 Tax=Streptomyces yerevanensis TaxID=66378 RepID=UPI0005257B9C|nr:phage baseplate assembly protein V [Streptomyces yerevanensis]
MTALPGPAGGEPYFGVVTGVVEKVEDDPEHECRVQLKLLRFDSAMITEWCRVAQPYAGNGYGVSLVPEEGDEVLVAFDQGDLRFPIVIGCLYNGIDKPPTHRSRNKDEKLLRTKHGHELVLDDSPGNEAVRLTSSAGHRITLDDANKSVVVRTASNGTVTVTADGSVEISAGSGSVTISGPSVTLETPKVNLGSNASQPVLAGTAFATWALSHTHPVAPSGVTGTPLPPGPSPLAPKVQVAM